jgi:hypothetical protein
VDVVQQLAHRGPKDSTAADELTSRARPPIPSALPPGTNAGALSGSPWLALRTTTNRLALPR